MRCFSPLAAWQNAAGEIHFYPKGTDGKSKHVKSADYVREFDLPCGQCVGCRVSRSHAWAMRCMHEASLHDESSFITLTYDEKNMPYQGQLVKAHFQDFMKRLRYYVGEVRYYACGEYGENFDRPHFHAIIFGHAFYADRCPIKKAANGFLYSSALLDKVWSYGFCSIGDVTFESAAYVAGYCIKKVNGPKADEHYTRVDGVTGEIYQKEPEFALMSRKPGIGADWMLKYSNDVINVGGVMVYDTKRAIPRYYLDVLEKRDEFQSDLLELSRFENRVMVDPMEKSYERMRVKEEVAKAKLKTKLRSL